MITGGGNHGPHNFRVYMPGGLRDDGVAGQAQFKIGEGITQILLAGQKILILGYGAPGDHRLEIGRGDIAFQVPVVDQIAGSQFTKISIDVLGSLLSTDTKAVTDMVGGQSTLPQGDNLDQAIAKQ